MGFVVDDEVRKMKADRVGLNRLLGCCCWGRIMTSDRSTGVPPALRGVGEQGQVGAVHRQARDSDAQFNPGPGHRGGGRGYDAAGAHGQLGSSYRGVFGPGVGMAQRSLGTVGAS